MSEWGEEREEGGLKAIVIEAFLLQSREVQLGLDSWRAERNWREGKLTLILKVTQDSTESLCMSCL